MIISDCPCLQNILEENAREGINAAKRKVSYLCCFSSHVKNFEEARNQLSRGREDLWKQVELLEDEAEAFSKEDTKTREKCFFGLCPDCIWQYQRGSKFAEMTQQINILLERNNELKDVASPRPKDPGIKYHAPGKFINFNSRKLKFEELVKALESGNSNMIGLVGFWRVGKTTLAQQAGLHVKQSGSFKEVIFTTVSDHTDINEIRSDIAKQLNVEQKEDGEQNSKALWSRIAKCNGKVLIILDDIQKELKLEDIGIRHNLDNWCVLITTSDSEVCQAMGCGRTISLLPLERRDGLDIFSRPVSTRNEDSYSEFMNLAQDFVEVCGGLPPAILQIANTLKDQPQRKWRKVLEQLRDFKPHDTNDKIDYRTKAHSILKLSYDKLEKKAKDLLLLCSLFPKDYEIPMELLSKLGIGLGLFGEANNYAKLREKLIQAKDDLKNSFFLLETKETFVKIHNLVPDGAPWIEEDKAVQVIMNSSSELKSNLRFLSWSNNGFPNHFDGTKLEVLLLRIKGGVEVGVEDSHAIFGKMVNLKVLFLCCDKDGVYPTLSLQSFHSLRNIRTLIFNGWKLDDISNLKRLYNLGTLEFEKCSIKELPKEILELEKLRFLGIRRCKIERKNTFEVIGSCSRLEELYFVENVHAIDSEPENNYEVAHGRSHPALQKYSVACSGLRYFARDEDDGLNKCFNTKHARNLMSEEMFKYLVEGAEILELCQMGEATWKSLVPGIIPMKDGVIMEGLKKLCLYDCPHIEFLLVTESLDKEVRVFPRLVELHLVRVGAKDLYRGRMPFSFLSDLNILKLNHCKNLSNKFFHHVNLKLPNLKVLQLDDCPKFEASIFGPSVARSLVLLEELSIKDCEKVESLIIKYPREEVVGANHQNSSDGSLFPKLRSLKIERCGKLQSVLSCLLAGDLPDLQTLSVRSCRKLEYIFDEYGEDEGQVLHKKNMLPSLTMMELEDVPSFIHICKAFNKYRKGASPTRNDSNDPHACCCLPSESGGSMKRKEASHPADQRPSKQSWRLPNRRERTVMEWPSLKRINLGRELVKTPFPHSMICLRRSQQNMGTRPDYMEFFKDMQKLTSLGIRHSEIEEIFNVEGIKSKAQVELNLQTLEIEGLHNLSCIYKDPNNILNLCNLEKLVFSGCDKLTAIFSTSTMKSLPQLSHLEVTQCKELVYIIEDDGDGGGSSRQLGLPMLQNIRISHCAKLESLFSISLFSMPQLERLEIEDLNLKEVFGCQQDDTQERWPESVAPELSYLTLKNLPNLEIFCRGIDIQSVKRLTRKSEVVNCAKLEKPQEPKRSQEIGTPGQTRALPNLQKNNEAILNGRVQGNLAPKNEADGGAVMNSLRATTVTPRQDLMKIEPRNETIMTLQQEIGQIRNVIYTTIEVQGFIKDHNKTSYPSRFLFFMLIMKAVIERIPEDPAIMERKGVPSSIDTQAGGSNSRQSTPTKLERAPKADVPHVIPYHQGVAGPSQILGISEILEAMELKDGEPALLVKALELYPQLRLSRDEQRTRPVIAFSYRVLIDILFMLATKTPTTITASEKLILKENLDKATCFGFDRDWIQSVRAKVFGNDTFDVSATKEEILVKMAKLETYRTTLKQVQNQRTEAIERVAVARRQMDIMQSELEAINSQLFGQLEERKKLIMDMMKFREITRAKFRPIGI